MLLSFVGIWAIFKEKKPDIGLNGIQALELAAGVDHYNHKRIIICILYLTIITFFFSNCSNRALTFESGLFAIGFSLISNVISDLIFPIDSRSVIN